MGCFIYVLLGSTKVITIGPTALLGLVTHDAAVSMGPEAVILLSFLSGLICILLGLLNLGIIYISFDSSFQEKLFKTGFNGKRLRKGYQNCILVGDPL